MGCRFVCLPVGVCGRRPVAVLASNSVVFLSTPVVRSVNLVCERTPKVSPKHVPSSIYVVVFGSHSVLVAAPVFPYKSKKKRCLATGDVSCITLNTLWKTMIGVRLRSVTRRVEGGGDCGSVHHACEERSEIVESLWGGTQLPRCRAGRDRQGFGLAAREWCLSVHCFAGSEAGKTSGPLIRIIAAPVDRPDCRRNLQ